MLLMYFGSTIFFFFPECFKMGGGEGEGEKGGGSSDVKSSVEAAVALRRSGAQGRPEP